MPPLMDQVIARQSRHHSDVHACNSFLNQTVWCYWEGNMPSYIQSCLISIRHACALSGNPFQLLTPNNLNNLDIMLPDGFNRIQHPAQRSDVIAAAVLHRYGGLFLDADIVFIGSLQSLWNAAKQNSAIFFRNHASDIAVWAVAAIENHPIITHWATAQSQILTSGKAIDWNALGSDALTSLVDGNSDSDICIINAPDTVQPIPWHQQREYYGEAAPPGNSPKWNKEWQRDWQPFVVLNNKVLPDSLKKQSEYEIMAQSGAMSELLLKAKNQRRKLIIGLGTGRCGTTSLARLLSTNGINASHEHEGFLHWQYQDEDKKIRDINTRIETLLSRNNDVIADVAFFYLPHIKQIIQTCTALNIELRFIVLRRNRSETIHSYTAWVSKKNAHHWLKNEDRRYTPDEWDVCYPSYDNMPLPDAIARYWDEYYQVAEYLVGNYPDLISIVPTDSLNSASGITDIARFIGVPLSTDKGVAIHENAFNTPMSIYWINMERSQQRRLHMQKRLESAEHSRINAIDAKDSTTYNTQIVFGNDLHFLRNHHHKSRDYPVSKEEFSCTASHLKAIAEAYQSGAPYAVISEDDVEWTAEATEKLKYLLGRLPKDCVLLQLTSIGPAETLRLLHKEYIDTGRNMIRRNSLLQALKTHGKGIKVECNGTQAYIINKRGMANLLKLFWRNDKVYFPFPENIMDGNFGALADELLYDFAEDEEGCTYVLTRPLVLWDENGSEIHTDHLPEHDRSKREIASSRHRHQAFTDLSFPVYWINLDSSDARRQRMSSRFERAGIKHCRIPAVNGDDPVELEQHICYSDSCYFNSDNLPDEYRKQPISDRELACTASHFKAILQAFNDGCELALILEDDVELGFLSVEWFQAIIENMPSDCGILQLATLPETAVERLASWSHKTGNSFIKKDATYSIKTIETELDDITIHGASAYLIRRSAMEKLIKYRGHNNQLRLPTDTDIRHNAALLADRLIYRDAATEDSMAYTLCHAVTLVEALDSELHPEHTPSHLKSRQAATKHILTKKHSLRPDWLKLK